MIAAEPFAAVRRAPGWRPLPRVLYAIAMDGSKKFGSLEEQIFFLAQAFRAEGSLFLPLFLNSPGGVEASTAAFAKAGLPTAGMNLWRFQWRTLRQLNALIGRERIQLMHWNFYSPVNGYVWLLSALRPRLQHYFTDHNSRLLPLPETAGGLNRLVKRTLLRRYRQVWCVSRFVHDCLAQQRSWTNLNCCLHFINTDRFQPDPQVRQAYRADHGVEGRFVALVVANLIAEKGVDVALRALALTPAAVVLWVVGGGVEADNLQALSHKLGVAERVRFFGQQTLVEPFMQAADCLLCPSLWAEAAGLVNLEALSSGLPVLASRIGGIPEYVEDGKTGLLFPPANHEALAALMCRLAGHPAECRRLSAQARASAVERFSVANNINDYLDLYRIFS
jgi:glycosyltransferase involved in cell wall biosynthesis